MRLGDENKMDVETIKTRLLVAMVILSIFLSTYLIFGITNSYAPIDAGFENVNFGRKPAIHELLKPWQTVVCFEKEQRLFNYIDSNYYKAWDLLESISFDSIRINWIMKDINTEIFDENGLFLNFGIDYDMSFIEKGYQFK